MLDNYCKVSSLQIIAFNAKQTVSLIFKTLADIIPEYIVLDVGNMTINWQSQMMTTQTEERAMSPAVQARDDNLEK